MNSVILQIAAKYVRWLLVFFAIVALSGYEKIFVSFGQVSTKEQKDEFYESRSYNLMEKADSYRNIIIAFPLKAVKELEKIDARPFLP